MGMIVRAIGAGVGLVAEATSSNKDPRRSDASSSPLRAGQSHGVAREYPPEYSDEDSISSGEDEDTWTLDDSLIQTPSKKSYGAGAQVTITSLVANVLSATRPPPYTMPELGMPIVIPQRRPGSRGRGFVRAYAPILDNYGIDQGTFLRFIENFDDAIQTSPVLGVVMLGATVAGFVPHGFSILAGSLAQVVVGAAMEYQVRSRGNSYMDQINEKLFKPRGLYAVIMTYVPNAPRPVMTESMDINDLLNGKRAHQSGLLGPSLQRDTTYGEMELPEAAPLIFPGINEEERARLLKANPLKKSAAWTQDYLDKRGQALWNHQNPDSRLTKAVDIKPTFKSRLADPNHPAFQGSWPTLFSGGHIPPKQKISKDEKRARKEAKRAAKYARQGYVADPTRDVRRQQQRTGKTKKAKSNILYLLVLPIPSEN